MTIRERLNALLSTPTRRRLAQGAIWGSVAAAGSRVLTVAASFFLARILGQVGFGEYGMVNGTAGMIGSLAGMGLGLTVTKHVAQFRSSDPDKVGRILALSSMVTMVSAVIYGTAFVVLAPWLAEKTIAAPHLAPFLQISAITVAMGVINGVQTSSLDGCEAFRAKSYISVGTGIAQTLMVVAGAWSWGLEGAVVAMALGMLLTVAVTRWVVSREWRRFNIHLQWREARNEWRVLVDFSLPTFLTILLIGPVYWICNAFLVNEPNGYAELGVFNAATQWQGAVALLPGLATTAMIPVMSERIGRGDFLGTLQVMNQASKAIAFVVIPIALVLSLLSPWIMRGYGTAFAGSHWTMALLLAAGVLSAIQSPLTQFVTATGLMWQGLVLHVAWIAILLPCSWYMVRWGAEGLSAARLIAQAFQFAAYSYLVLRQRTRSGTQAMGPG